LKTNRRAAFRRAAVGLSYRLPAASRAENGDQKRENSNETLFEKDFFNH
jgi:hypothetical protein